MIDLGQAPPAVTTVATPGNAIGVAADAARVVVGTWNGDFTNPDPGHGVLVWPTAGPFGAPQSVLTPGWAGAVALNDALAFVADGPGELRLMSLTPPTEVGFANTQVRAYGVAVADDRAYVADNSGGLVVFDVADPTQPVQLGQLDLPGAAYGVAIDATAQRAWVACDSGGVQIVDVASPSAMTVLHEIATTRAWHVALSSTHAYVADTNGGLRVFRRPR